MIALGVIMFSSCATRKVIIVKDMQPDTAYIIKEAYPLQMQKGDRLNIVVSSKNPELAIPFNSGVGSYQVNNQANIEAGLNATTTMESAYLVNPDGTIDFPILGKIKVEGLNIEQIRETIAKTLRDQKYISDPVVKVELRNLKINMMGEVGKIGLINAPEGKINLLEAISQAGGLTKNADVEKITVIRENKGIRTMMYNNIESNEIFNSPTYHLQQNDIVYVAPKDPELTQSLDNKVRFLGIGLSVISIVLTVLLLTK